MATDIENARTRKSAILAELAAGQTPAGQSFRHPDMTEAGAGVQMVAYVESLNRQIEVLDKIIAKAEGPFEIASIGLT